MLAAAKEKAFALTSHFEGDPPPGGRLAGNFDQQLLSYGPLQWNVKQGTLLPLLRSVYAADPAGYQAALGPGASAALRDQSALEHFVRLHVLAGGKMPTGEYRRRFRELAQLEATQRAFLEHAEPYFQRAARDCLKLGLVSERAFAFMFDVAVQNGGLRYHDHLRSYWLTPRTGYDEEWMRLKNLAYAVAAGSLKQWQDDVLARKLTIATRIGTVHGKSYDLFRDFRISHAVPWRA